jgi:hypothetical protein
MWVYYVIFMTIHITFPYYFYSFFFIPTKLLFFLPFLSQYLGTYNSNMDIGCLRVIMNLNEESQLFALILKTIISFSDEQCMIIDSSYYDK